LRPNWLASETVKWQKSLIRSDVSAHTLIRVQMSTTQIDGEFGFCSMQSTLLVSWTPAMGRSLFRIRAQAYRAEACPVGMRYLSGGLSN
jgi:hypothetical protein